MTAILEEEIANTDFSDYMAVGTCGPAGLTQDVANAVSDAILTEKVLRGEHRRNIVSSTIAFPLLVLFRHLVDCFVFSFYQRFHCEEFGW